MEQYKDENEMRRAHYEFTVRIAELDVLKKAIETRIVACQVECREIEDALKQMYTQQQPPTPAAPPMQPPTSQGAAPQGYPEPQKHASGRLPFFGKAPKKKK